MEQGKAADPKFMAGEREIETERQTEIDRARENTARRERERDVKC